MLERNQKAEIQALSAISLDFLSAVYLPHKIDLMQSQGQLHGSEFAEYEHIESRQ